MKLNIRKLISLILVAVCLVSTIKVVLQLFDNRKGDDSYQNAAALAHASHSSTIPSNGNPMDASEPFVPEESEQSGPRWIPAPVEGEDENLTTLASTDLSALRQVNPDVIGWICIPNTQINYPLMQGQDNTYYLEHTWEGKPNPYGSIFLECENIPDFTEFNTIVYGHNMNNGSMFGALPTFAYEWHWKQSPYVYIVTDEGVFRYEIFSSYSAEVDSPTYGLSFNQQKTREDFISMALEKSQIDTGITPAPTDRIITLSTCTGLGYENRRVVHAYLKMIPVETQ